MYLNSARLHLFVHLVWQSFGNSDSINVVVISISDVGVRSGKTGGGSCPQQVETTLSTDTQQRGSVPFGRGSNDGTRQHQSGFRASGDRAATSASAAAAAAANPLSDTTATTQRTAHFDDDGPTSGTRKKGVMLCFGRAGNEISPIRFVP